MTEELEYILHTHQKVKPHLRIQNFKEKLTNDIPYKTEINFQLSR